MKPPTAPEAPRLVPIAVADQRGRSLEVVVLEVLADREHGICPVCEGAVMPIRGGVRCAACGSEVLSGEEPAYAQAA